ncbi:hypothetical protein AN639_09775 [Candidatus Epulonipiscium fishelsonii]|uniref:Uncharacterized protein n=1 Tax=Candidatus Epulonipiscium fishelsonii TaxID=77094 RepID=A0ACC8XG16_9FIRM|nr:hypothetical protein AN639_09775 [Epulopiscium sp. SCG-B05WGA-EpuloA1]ONI42547.1 hypothetical protein AN396_13870 [Epulopiscium sp. SCG-B11WGA-EpuloA1]
MLNKIIANLSEYIPCNCALNKIICEKFGVLLSGVKSLEIFTIPIESYKIILNIQSDVKVRIVKSTEDSIQLLLYSPNDLNKLLLSENRVKYLIELGYPTEYTLDSYMDFLINKIREEATFPHEIGFFLGYTMKDVLAYMGMDDSPYVKTLGWNMYGDTNESELLYYKRKHVSQQIRLLLNYVPNL